ncbi:hypothetical protein JYQ62_12885 [Nostoc sp. UHCC 0702]|nr:hypothetical protein JYQ62_12885 [Nostoc sp. UHCC 0702]
MKNLLSAVKSYLCTGLPVLRIDKIAVPEPSSTSGLLMVCLSYQVRLITYDLVGLLGNR